MTSQSLYEKLIQIIPHIETRTEAGKSILESEAMMDLNLDILYRESDIIRIALSHYYKVNGDMVADPDMEMIVNTRLKTVNAMNFQSGNVYHTSELDGGYNQKLIEELNEFLGIWLQNCIDQGHRISGKE